MLKSSLLVLLLALSTSTMVLTGCFLKNNPSSPFNPNPTITPATTATPTSTNTPLPEIDWYSADFDRTAQSGVTHVNALIALNINGQALTNAQCVVAGGGIADPVTLPFSAALTVSGQLYAQYSLTDNGLAYQPGQIYTVTTTSGAFSASVTFTAPGNITNAADGSQASWTLSGDQEFIWVYSSGAFRTYSSAAYFPGGQLTSPFSIPATAYSNYGNFTLTTEVLKTCASISGATSQSYIWVYDKLTTPVP